MSLFRPPRHTPLDDSSLLQHVHEPRHKNARWFAACQYMGAFPHAVQQMVQDVCGPRLCSALGKVITSMLHRELQTNPIERQHVTVGCSGAPKHPFPSKGAH